MLQYKNPLQHLICPTLKPVRSFHPTLVTSTKVSVTSSQHFVAKIAARPASDPIFLSSSIISKALASSSSTAAAACLVFSYISCHRTHLCLQLYTLQNCYIHGKPTDDSLDCFVLFFFFPPAPLACCISCSQS